jgi:CheY-like chemotaxis protein
MLNPKPKHIFIVEDNEVYSMLLDYILSKDSVYDFVSFKSGEECLANLHLHPDVIILDHGLPGMSGYDTLLEIKNRKPGIHVIVLTGFEDKALEEKYRKAGADDFILKKGHGEEQIIERIEAILSKDEVEKEPAPAVKSLGRTVLYFFLVLFLVMLGMFLSQKIREEKREQARQAFINASYEKESR